MALTEQRILKSVQVLSQQSAANTTIFAGVILTPYPCFSEG